MKSVRGKLNAQASLELKGDTAIEVVAWTVMEKSYIGDDDWDGGGECPLYPLDRPLMGWGSMVMMVWCCVTVFGMGGVLFKGQDLLAVGIA